MPPNALLEFDPSSVACFEFRDILCASGLLLSALPLDSKEAKHCGTSSPSNKISRVKFQNGPPQIIEIEHIKDLQAAGKVDTNTMWYNEKEFRAIASQCRQTIRQMDNGDSALNDEEHCARGLEHETSQGRRRRRRNRKSTVGAVLQVQNTHRWDSSIVDDVVLADVYALGTMKCRRDAHKIGLQDELEVTNYLAGMQNLSR